jgi:hypothetical protein
MEMEGGCCTNASGTHTCIYTYAARVHLRTLASFALSAGVYSANLLGGIRGRGKLILDFIACVL